MNEEEMGKTLDNKKLDNTQKQSITVESELTHEARCVSWNDFGIV